MAKSRKEKETAHVAVPQKAQQKELRRVKEQRVVHVLQ